MDLFNRYYGRVGCMPQRTSSAWRSDPRYSKKNSLRKLYKFGRDLTVGSKVIDLLSRYSGRVGSMPQLTSLARSSDYMLLKGKQPTETPLKI